MKVRFTRRHTIATILGPRKAALCSVELHSDLHSERLISADSSVNEVEIFIKSGDTLTDTGKVGLTPPIVARNQSSMAATNLNLSSTPTPSFQKVRRPFRLIYRSQYCKPDHFYGIISSMSFKSLSTLASFFAWFFQCVLLFSSRKTEASLPLLPDPVLGILDESTGRIYCRVLAQYAHPRLVFFLLRPQPWPLDSIFHRYNFYN